MFVAGGSSFLLLGAFHKHSRLSVPVKGLAGSGIITLIELLTGLLTNRKYTVWDYRDAPFNYRGQICLPFSLLWIPVSLGAMALYRFMDHRLPF